MEAIEQTWNGSEVTSGRCATTFSRNGDLVHKNVFRIRYWYRYSSRHGANPGATSIVDVELEIGGQKIDKHTGLWMEVWAELTEPNPTGQVGCATNTNIVGSTLFQKMSGMGGVKDGNTTGGDLNKLYVPLQFWFCRNPGLALPLIALQYHEVKVILNHKISDNSWRYYRKKYPLL